MKQIDLIGLCYATGVSYCDRNITTHPGYYKEIAYVWESGKIDWKVKAESIPTEDRETIYRCSASHINKINEQKIKVRELIKEFPEWNTKRNTECSSIREFNCTRYIRDMLQRFEDLKQYDTTQVIHY